MYICPYHDIGCFHIDDEAHQCNEHYPHTCPHNRKEEHEHKKPVKKSEKTRKCPFRIKRVFTRGGIYEIEPEQASNIIEEYMDCYEGDCTAYAGHIGCLKIEAEFEGKRVL